MLNAVGTESGIIKEKILIKDCGLINKTAIQEEK
jgi:hypothetical protein